MDTTLDSSIHFDDCRRRACRSETGFLEIIALKSATTTQEHLNLQKQPETGLGPVAPRPRRSRAFFDLIVRTCVKNRLTQLANLSPFSVSSANSASLSASAPKSAFTAHKPPQTTTINSIASILRLNHSRPFRHSQNLSHNQRNVFNNLPTLTDHPWLAIRLGSGADSVSVHPRAASIWTFVECPGGKSFFDN